MDDNHLLAELGAKEAREVLDALEQRAPAAEEWLTRARWTIPGARVLLENIERLAAARRMDFTSDELRRQQRFGLENIGYLVKLTNLYNAAMFSKTHERWSSSTLRSMYGLKARVACAKHIFSGDSGRSDVRIDDLVREDLAVAVFQFGARQFDALFEMGDGRQVVEALEEAGLTDDVVAENCGRLGWGHRSRERVTE